MHIVGESYRQDALARVAGGSRGRVSHRMLVRAMLVADPTNQYDSTAVAVYAETPDHKWELVGYLGKSRVSKESIHHRLVESGSVCCPGELRGGYEGFTDENGTVEPGMYGLIIYPRQAAI
jgi:hypothetical protein